MPPLLFRSKYDVVEDHHARLRDHPEPDAAARRFGRRLRQAKFVNQVKAGLYVIVYFSLVATAGVFLLRFLDVLGPLRDALEFAGTVSSSVAIVAVAGVFVCGRYLNLLDVELYFYSMESRLPSR